MRKLEVLNDKHLKLRNLLVFELRQCPIDELDQRINQFIDQVTMSSVQRYGPLITCNYGTQVSEQGQIHIDYDVMVQVRNYQIMTGGYRFLEERQYAHCVYLHFDEHPQYANYAYSKLELHFFETGLQPKGELISVILDDQPERLVLDLFKPVVTL